MPNRLLPVSRVLLVVGLALVLLTSGALGATGPAQRTLLVVLTVVACGSLLLTDTGRGRPASGVGPRVSTTAAVVLAGCGVVLCWLLPDSGAPAVPLVVSRLAAQARLRTWLRYALLGVATVSLLGDNLVGHGPWWAYLAWPVGVGVLYQSGLRVQSRRQQLEDAELLLAQEQALREEQVRSAAAAERTRIARELHDVLAHTLSGLTVTLQATAALLEAEGASAAARDQVGRARALAVDGLAEARTAVASLATSDDGAAPVDLVAVVGRQVREHRVTTGADATLDVTGFDAEGLDASSGVRVGPVEVGVVSRILREALTNAVRHAPGRAVHVVLEAGGDLVLRVTVDEGRPAEPGADGGLGLTGMRERAAEVGGRLEAGPAPEGWRVEARLPLAAGPDAGGE